MHGCCVLQKALDSRPIYEGSVKHKMVNILIMNATELITHPYGNYIIQMMLKSKQQNVSQAIQSKIGNDIVNHSCDKFGSHVVEIYLETCSASLRKNIISQICNCESIRMMLMD